MPGAAGWRAPQQPSPFGAAVGPGPGPAAWGPAAMQSPWAATAAVPGPREFAHLLEVPIYPGQEQNARIIDRFNRGQASTDQVLRVTSSCLNKLGNNWNAAVACLHALSRCRHPQTGQGVYPDTITYNAAISACEKGGRPDKALELFDHLLKEGPNFPTPVYPDTITYSAAISACEKAGRADRYPELLLRGINGVPGRPETQVFQPSLGFNPALNKLDFHERVALTRLTNPTERNPAVHPAVAQAIFHVLLKEPQKIWGPGAAGINDKTEFVVGQHGADSVKDIIAQCIREQGWTPVHPLGTNNLPNLGALVVQPRQALPAPSATTGRKLNPFAKEFKPDQWG